MNKENKTTNEMKETVKASKYFDVCIKNDAGEVLFSGQIDVIIGAFHFKDGSGTETLNASVGPMIAVLEASAAADDLIEAQQDRIVNKFLGDIFCKKESCGESCKPEECKKREDGDCKVDFEKMVKNFFGMKD